MLNFKELDEKYIADVEDGYTISFYERNSIFRCFGNCTVSEAFEKVKSGELQKTFDPNSGETDNNLWRIARELNDEAGVVSRDPWIHLYTNIDHMKTKEPVKIPENLRFVPAPSETKEKGINLLNKQIAYINQALGLIPEKPKDKKRVDIYKDRLKKFLERETEYNLEGV